MYVCMYVRMYVSIYLSIYLYVCMYVCMSQCFCARLRLISGADTFVFLQGAHSCRSLLYAHFKCVRTDFNI